jgi:hypothetical protein
MNKNGGIVSVAQRDHLSRNSYLQGKAICIIDNWQIPTFDGVSQTMSRITEWNASTGSLNWQMEQNGWASIYGPINGEDIMFQANGKISFIRPTGEEAVWNVTTLQGDWSILEYNERGLLFSDDHGTIGRTDNNGSMMWEYGLDSQVITGSLGHSGGVIVITHDYVISIHKPVLSTTMNYFIVLLAIDLFVTLMSAVGIIDKMWPKAKARVE